MTVDVYHPAIQDRMEAQHRSASAAFQSHYNLEHLEHLNFIFELNQWNKKTSTIKTGKILFK